MTGRKKGSVNTATLLLERAADEWAAYADEHPLASSVDIGKRFGINPNTVHSYLTRRGYDFTARRTARGAANRAAEQAAREARLAARTAKAAPTPEQERVPLPILAVNEILAAVTRIENNLAVVMRELGVKLDA